MEPERHGIEPEDEWEPEGARDPRLEIPEVLRRPVVRPESVRDKAPPAVVKFGDMGRAWGTALDFVFSVIGGVALGWLGDYLAGTTPWMMLGGLVVGMTVGITKFVREAGRASRGTRAGGTGIRRPPR